MMTSAWLEAMLGVVLIVGASTASWLAWSLLKILYRAIRWLCEAYIYGL
jgi:hypothetical protein